MFFDDRLATVLRQESASPAARRTQFRQLLDILGNRPVGDGSNRGGRSDPSLIAAAWLRMDALGRSIPPGERAMIIREPSWRFRSADLAAHLADFEPEVAAAALSRAQLSSEDWSALIPRLPVRARGFLRLRRDLPADVEALLERLGVSDRGLPVPAAARQPQGESADRDADVTPPFMLLDLDREAEIAARGEPDAEQTGPQGGASEAARRAPATPPEIDLIETPANDTNPGDAGPAEIAPDETGVTKTDRAESGRSEISALVERIAQFKRTREAEETETPEDIERSPHLPLGLPPGDAETALQKVSQGFGFSTDTSGRIDWAEADVAPMVIGARLYCARAPDDYPASEQPRSAALRDDSGETIRRAFDQRQPISNCPTQLQGAPVIAGQWCLDAQPRFTIDGHFTGYVGRFRRPAGEQAGPSEKAAREADRIRELLHELRTPVTAVQGYAEVIQQQLFGPAPHEYRALAASIAADAAHILAGFEELDRLARLETGTTAIEDGSSDLAQIVQTMADQLGQVLGPRQAGIEISIAPDIDFLIPIAPIEAEAMVWRLLASLAGACEAGEVIAIELEARHGLARLTCDLPRQILGVSAKGEQPENSHERECDIFRSQVRPMGNSVNAGVFGTGFLLRLARAEARAAGGNLVQTGMRVEVNLPLLAPQERAPAPESPLTA